MPDDTYSEYLKQQILEAYGFDETMTPQDRELWDAYNQLMDAVDATKRASEANVMAAIRNAPAWVTEQMRARGELPDGLRFEWGAR
jgi:hypothetical protein